MVEVMKIMVTFFKMSHAGTAAVNDPYPAAGHCRPTPPPETPGYSQASLGQSPVGSLLLSPGPGAHKVLFVPSKSLFPQFCVSSVIKFQSLQSQTLSVLSPFAISPGLEICCGF